jgi:hypothetical protein
LHKVKIPVLQGENKITIETFGGKVFAIVPQAFGLFGRIRKDSSAKVLSAYWHQAKVSAINSRCLLTEVGGDFSEVKKKLSRHNGVR